MESEQLVLGIDVGTSSVKFCIVDQNLTEYYYSNVEYKYDILNKDWTEIDPTIWTDIINTEFSKIFKLPFSKKIIGICPTAQMHTIIFLDKNNLPIRKAILWNDRRTKKDIPYLKMNLEQNINLDYNANITSTGSPLANLLWLKVNEPENFRLIKKICMCKDYINVFLTGRIVTDYCDASTSGLMDLEKGAWSKKICEYFGIDIGILPLVQTSTEQVGVLKESICQQLAIKNKIPVFTGTGDNAATVLATKYCEKSNLILSLGTSGVVLTENENLSLTSKNILFRYLDKKYILSQSSLSTGGKSFDWWINNILNSTNYSDEQIFSIERIMKNDVLFLPYLSGEKYIYKNPDISGVFYNLNTENERVDLNLAVLEGVVFALKLLYSTSSDSKQKLNELIFLGGGSKSEAWTNIVANVFGTEVLRFKDSIEAVTGAAIIGLIASDKKIATLDRNMQRTLPETKLEEHYLRKYNYFSVLSDKINELSLMLK